MKIPFDVKHRQQIESGKYKVETNEGASVRIICWDAKGSQREDDIIALVGSILGSENIQRYDYTGHLIADSARVGRKDLVLVTEEFDLTDVEKAIARGFLCAGITNTHGKIIRETASEVKDIVEKMISKSVKQDTLIELQKNLYSCPEKLPRWLREELERIRLEEHTKGFTKGYDKGYKDAQESTTYSFPISTPSYTPPCFNGGICTNPFRDCINCPNHLTGGLTTLNTSSGDPE